MASIFYFQLTVLTRRVEEQATEDGRHEVVEALQGFLEKLEEETDPIREELEEELPAKACLDKTHLFHFLIAEKTEEAYILWQSGEQRKIY